MTTQNNTTQAHPALANLTISQLKILKMEIAAALVKNGGDIEILREAIIDAGRTLGAERFSLLIKETQR